MIQMEVPKEAIDKILLKDKNVPEWVPRTEGLPAGVNVVQRQLFLLVMCPTMDQIVKVLSTRESLIEHPGVFILRLHVLEMIESLIIKEWSQVWYHQ